MKRKTAFILSLLLALAFALCACGGNDAPKMTEISPEGMPDYSADIDEKVFTFGQWVNVPNRYSWIEGSEIKYGDSLSEEQFALQYRYVRESGINLAGVQLGCGSLSDCHKLLAAAEKEGLRQLVTHFDLTAVLCNTAISDAVAIARAEELVASYKDHPNLAGHSITDEPTYRELDGLGVAYRRYKQIFPDKLFYVNLFPVVTPPPSVPDYEQYIRKAAQVMPDTFLSYDYYPLQGDEQHTWVLGDFLYNMELVQDYKNPEQEMWTFLQISSVPTRGAETKADIAWQVYSFMAFGGRGIQWFCYWDVPSEPFYGMVNGKGERTDIYYKVQEVSREVLNFDHIYLNYAWQGVLTYAGEKATEENGNFAMLDTSLLRSHERIASVKSEQDLLVGAFKEGENDGFMVVNFADPGKLLTSKVEIKFNNCTKALVVRRGETKAYALQNGVFAAELEPGEGVFIIPVA